MTMPRQSRRSGKEGYLDGQLLIAMPIMSDPRFARSVIYICAHSEDGAMGLVINQRASHISFPDLLTKLNIVPASAEGISDCVRKMSIYVGGPVETGRGFVLHSSDYFIENSTLPIDEHVCLTATLEILKAIAVGTGPQNAMLALGYAGWAPGQLETEIQSNGWLHCPARPELIFDTDLEAKYSRVLGMIGVDPVRLSGEAGHA
jgi:putative transcriptional regulator